VIQARQEDLPMSDQFWLTKSACRTRHHALHSTASQAPVARNILQDFVSTAPQGREYVRKAKRLAAYLNALRSLRFFSAICIAATVIFWLGQ
jgi:hypothetical protein